MAWFQQSARSKQDRLEWSAAELQEESDGKQSAKMYPAFSGEWSPGA